jgi:hypothetical protein
MTAFRVYHVLADRGLQYRCTVVSTGETGALLRARQHVSVDGRRRLALIPEPAYCEVAANADRANV